MKILFLHGWQLVPGGVKPTFLAQHGHEVVNPKLPDDDFNLAVKIAQEEFDQHQPVVVVGSSRGGAVAININSGDARLVLLCPAWKKWGTVKAVHTRRHQLGLNDGAAAQLVGLPRCPIGHRNGLPTRQLPPSASHTCPNISMYEGSPCRTHFAVTCIIPMIHVY